MEYSYSVKEVIDALGLSYRSVDLRAILVALGDNQGWRCTFAIIRFSCKSPEEISEEHDALRRDLHLPIVFSNHSLAPELNLKPFKGMNVELSSYHIDRFDHIVGRLNEGLIGAETRAFRMWDEPVANDLPHAPMSWRDDPYAADYGEWPVYHLGLGQQSVSLVGSTAADGGQARVDERDLNLWAREVGFSTFRDVCERLLRAPYGQGSKLEIRAPIYARIDDVLHLERSVRVRGRVHHQIGQLAVECSVHGRRGPYQEVTPASMLGQIDINQGTQGDEVACFSEEFSTQNPPEVGLATAVLFKRGAARFDLGEKREPLRSGLSVFNVFTSFVPEAVLDEYLECLIAGRGITTCQLYTRFTGKQGSDPVAGLLEYVTNYILGLCQLNPILLSNPQYDVLSGGMGAASADILAMTPKKEPLLVSCTMGMPDQKKIGLLLAARTAISQRFGWPGGQIKVLLVTGKPSVPHADSETQILAAEHLHQLWGMIKKGDMLGAWSLIGV